MPKKVKPTGTKLWRRKRKTKKQHIPEQIELHTDINTTDDDAKSHTSKKYKKGRHGHGSPPDARDRRRTDEWVDGAASPGQTLPVLDTDRVENCVPMPPVGVVNDCHGRVLKLQFEVDGAVCDKLGVTVFEVLEGALLEELGLKEDKGLEPGEK
ncbi:hypothetical protein GALMADRAFT_276750 [Galerina marginata CBS 339.88]|uniref:Uncharacterized protein n=1 Tax=Galerina marginata (strain CBS 339.88) TaxID=685588 RepID=A0A067TGA9_GALM3|nr:hypothetical protein GALMADRAFT_276750 [Galerina marginata CBS 339.88]